MCLVLFHSHLFKGPLHPECQQESENCERSHPVVLYLLVLLVVGVVLTFAVLAVARWVGHEVILPYSDPEGM